MRAAKVQASLRIRAVSPEPPLLAHTSSESRGTFRQKARSLALLNGWACAVKICHDGMLKDTNLLDAAQLVWPTIIVKHGVHFWLRKPLAEWKTPPIAKQIIPVVFVKFTWFQIIFLVLEGNFVLRYLIDCCKVVLLPVNIEIWGKMKEFCLSLSTYLENSMGIRIGSGLQGGFNCWPILEGCHIVGLVGWATHNLSWWKAVRYTLLLIELPHGSTSIKPRIP